VSFVLNDMVHHSQNNNETESTRYKNENIFKVYDEVVGSEVVRKVNDAAN
jgi:hypothetical protein